MPSPSLVAQLMEEEEALASTFIDGGADRAKPYFYLAGPMTNIPQFNFPAFDAAAKVLRDAGYNLVNPAELDEEIERKEAYESPDGSHTGLPHVKTWRQCLRRDIDIVLDDNCVGMICLDGWEKSGGARMETYVATATGVPLYEYFYDEDLGEHMLVLVDRTEALREAGVEE
jgi:hypothetical protein